jgi:hypothetical protein
LNALKTSHKPCAALATTPPTGPVFLSLPMDIMTAEANLDVTRPPFLGPRIRGDLAHMQRQGPTSIDVPLEADFPVA